MKKSNYLFQMRGKLLCLVMAVGILIYSYYPSPPPPLPRITTPQNISTYGKSVAKVNKKVKRALSYNPYWQFMGYVPSERLEALVQQLQGKLYVFCGFKSEEKKLVVSQRSDIYDLKNDAWKRLTDMPAPVTHAGIANDGGNIWIAGGFLGNHPGKAVANVWRYEISSDTWFAEVPLPEEKASAPLLFLNKKLYFFGGLEPDRQTDSAKHWILSLEEKDKGWRRAADFPNARNHLGALVWEEKIYALGGQHRHDKDCLDINSAHVYDPKENKWQEIASLPYPRSHFEAAIFTFQNEIFISGGRNNKQRTVSDIYAYNPKKNSWRKVGDLPFGILAPFARVFDNRLIVGTGGVGDRDIVSMGLMFSCDVKFLFESKK